MVVGQCGPNVKMLMLEPYDSNHDGFIRRYLETGEPHVESDADKVRVSVKDSGPGIPPEYQEKVFDKFFQVEARQQGQKYSTGLGLTFCKLAVEAHGGHIGVTSGGGQGSIFWFELPVHGPGRQADARALSQK